MEYLSLHENRQYDPVHSRQVEHQQRLSERPVGSMISAVSVSMLVTGPHKFFPRHLVLAQWHFGTHFANDEANRFTLIIPALPSAQPYGGAIGRYIYCSCRPCLNFRQFYLTSRIRHGQRLVQQRCP